MLTLTLTPTAGVIRVSADEGKKLGILEAESVRLENGDVVASLNVFQEMDCIVRLLPRYAIPMVYFMADDSALCGRNG